MHVQLEARQRGGEREEDKQGALEVHLGGGGGASERGSAAAAAGQEEEYGE